MFKRVI